MLTALRAAYGGDPLPLEALDVARALLEVTPDLPPAKRPVGRPAGRFVTLQRPGGPNRSRYAATVWPLQIPGAPNRSRYGYASSGAATL